MGSFKSPTLNNRITYFKCYVVKTNMLKHVNDWIFPIKY